MDPGKASGFDHVVDLNLNDNLLSIPMRSCIAQFSGPSSLFGMRPNCSHSRLFALLSAVLSSSRPVFFSFIVATLLCFFSIPLFERSHNSGIHNSGMSLVIGEQKASVLMLPGR